LFSNVLYTSDTNQATAHVAADLIADHFIQYNKLMLDSGEIKLVALAIIKLRLSESIS